MDLQAVIRELQASFNCLHHLGGYYRPLRHHGWLGAWVTCAPAVRRRNTLTLLQMVRCLLLRVPWLVLWQRDDSRGPLCTLLLHTPLLTSRNIAHPAGQWLRHQDMVAVPSLLLDCTFRRYADMVCAVSCSFLSLTACVKAWPRDLCSL